MLNRLRFSLVAPASLIEYRNDSLLKVWAYVLFFAVLTAIGPVIRIVTQDGVSLSDKETIISVASPSVAGCAFDDARLVCADETHEILFTHGQFAFALDGHETIDFARHRGRGLTFVAHDEHVYLVFLGVPVYDRRIEAFHEDVHHLDFAYEPEEKSEHFRQFFTAVDQEVLALRPLLVASAVIATTLSSIVLFTIVIMLNTFLSRVRLQAVPFKQLYVMMSYAGTALYIVFVFESMIQFNFFLFLILLLIAFYQMSKLTFEIQRRIMRK